MALELHHRAQAQTTRLAILPAAFDPPTRAHVALADAALADCNEVLLVLPRVFPHKPFDGVGFEDRLKLLLVLTAAHPRYSVGSVSDGLFASIARDCRAVYGDATELLFLCGRDAAERIAHWDYGSGPSFAEQLQGFQILVAKRGQHFAVPESLRSRVHTTELCDCDEVSSTEVRQRLRAGLRIDDLVPAEIADEVQRLYA